MYIVLDYVSGVKFHETPNYRKACKIARQFSKTSKYNLVIHSKRVAVYQYAHYTDRDDKSFYFYVALRYLCEGGRKVSQKRLDEEGIYLNEGVWRKKEFEGDDVRIIVNASEWRNMLFGGDE